MVPYQDFSKGGVCRQGKVRQYCDWSMERSQPGADKEKVGQDGPFEGPSGEVSIHGVSRLWLQWPHSSMIEWTEK